MQKKIEYKDVFEEAEDIRDPSAWRIIIYVDDEKIYETSSYVHYRDAVEDADKVRDSLIELNPGLTIWKPNTQY